MLSKRFGFLLALMMGLAAAGCQAVTAPAPTQTPVVEAATPPVIETPTMPGTQARLEQQAQEFATPTQAVEAAPTEQSSQSGGVAIEEEGQPTAVATAQIEPTGEATDLSATCEGQLEATVSNSEGPYYKSGAPERAALIEPGMPGTPLLLTGQVLTTDCRPVAGALLDFWQADDRGEYDNVGYTLRGRQFADDMGRYRLETILPGLYPGRPPHIHVKVSAPGGPVLTTQIYFEGQPGNESDGLVQPSLLVSLTNAVDGGKAATFNFVLPSEQATSPAAPALQEYPMF